MSQILNPTLSNPRFNPSTIPSFMRSLKQWTLWGHRTQKGIDVLTKDKKGVEKLNKIPFNPTTGKSAKSNDSSTWATFDEAMAAYNRGMYNGVGFFFNYETDGIAGIDLDHCLVDGQLSDDARRIVDQFPNTFIDISPSGDGLHIYVKGMPLSCGKGTKDKWIELYGRAINGKKSNRYFCITGNVFENAPYQITDGQVGLAWLHETFKAALESPPQKQSQKTSCTDSLDLNSEQQQVEDALKYIDPNSDYDIWLRVGMALKAGGYDVSLWDSWSSGTSKNKTGECASKWASFNSSGVGIATLFEYAKQGGYRPRKNGQTAVGTHLSVPTESIGTPPWPNDPIENKGENSGCHGWHAPTPIVENKNSLCEVTADMLPQNVGGWINDISERMQMYPTFPSTAMISFVSAIIARRIAIHPKRFDDGWRVIPNIWGAIVGQPGVQKTPSLAPMFEPIRKRESQLRKEHQAALKTYQNALDDWKSTPKDERKEKPIEPTRRTLYTNDATLESLHRSHEGNPQGLLLYRDELSGFIETMGRQGREGERQFYLEGWSGDGSHSVDRISRASVYVDQLCLTVFGGVQPHVLSRYVSNAASGKADDGFIQRFQLLVESTPKENYTLTDTQPDYQAKTLFEETINRLLDLPMHGEPVITSFDDNAQPVFNSWLETLERRLRNGKLPPILASHLSKYRSLLPSLAVIFEVIDNINFCVERITQGDLLPKVSLTSLNLAIKWVNFLEKHARNLLLDSPSEPSEAALLAEKILQKFRSGGKCQDGMGLRDFRRLFRAKNDSKNLNEALAILNEFGWLRADGQKPPHGGKIKEVIRVNPCLFEKTDNGSVPNAPNEESAAAGGQKNTVNSVNYIGNSSQVESVPTDGKTVPTVFINYPEYQHQCIDNNSNNGNISCAVQNVPDGDKSVPGGGKSVPSVNGEPSPKDEVPPPDVIAPVADPQKKLSDGLMDIWRNDGIVDAGAVLDALEELDNKLGNPIPGPVWDSVVNYLARTRRDPGFAFDKWDFLRMVEIGLGFSNLVVPNDGVIVPILIETQKKALTDGIRAIIHDESIENAKDTRDALEKLNKTFKQGIDDRVWDAITAYIARSRQARIKNDPRFFFKKWDFLKTVATWLGH